ncbi:hypothetical protein GQ457_06G024320 [Hibiscus cannabinus]
MLYYIALYEMLRRPYINTILTKDSCGSGGSSYRRTRNGELSPLRLFGLKNAGFYGRSATPGYRRRPWGDLVVPTGWRRQGHFAHGFSYCCITTGVTAVLSAV